MINIINIILIIVLIISSVGLGWMFGYEEGWHDRFTNQNHRLRKKSGDNLQ